jgi:hypothetical protein
MLSWKPVSAKNKNRHRDTFDEKLFSLSWHHFENEEKKLSLILMSPRGVLKHNLQIQV